MNYTISKVDNKVTIVIEKVFNPKFVKELISFLEGETEEANLSVLEKECLEYCRQDRKLDAIKHYKDVTSMGLKESKEVVDELCKKFLINK